MFDFRKNFFAVIILSILSHSVYSQTCGTDEHHKWRLRTDANYRKEFYETQNRVDQAIVAASKNGRRQMLYTIPVVVHVIHLGEPLGSGSNISTQQILGAIDGLNDRFRNIIGDGVDMEIEFCLASVDPQGIPATGINRVDGSGVADFAAAGIAWDTSGGADQDAVKWLSLWPHLEYYNIWVVHNIYGPPAGFASYPTSLPNEGTVIESNFMTYSSHFLAHELGHGLDLFHTFEGGCHPEVFCDYDGDYVCDTPPHEEVECGLSGSCSSTADWDNSRYNYMSYCPVASRFTQGQKDRVAATLTVSPRLDLLSSQACAVDSNCIAANCDDSHLCTVDDCLNGICFYESPGWVQRTPFGGIGREIAKGFSIGNKGYIGCGRDSTGTELADFWEYDAAIDSWTRKADFPGALREGAVSFNIGNKGYLGMGYAYDINIYFNDFWEYDPAMNAWTQKASCSGVARANATGFGIGDRGYIGLGGENGNKLSDVWEYNPQTNSWTQKNDFPGVARFSAVGFNMGGKGYAGLGRSYFEFWDFWEYDPANDSWTRKSYFPDSSSTIEAGFSAGNSGYVLTLGSLWSYNVTNDEWNLENTPISYPSFYPAYSVAFGIGNTGYIGTGSLLGKDFWSSCQCTTPSAPDSINGNESPCVGEQEIYSTIQIDDNAYTWTLPSGWSILTGQGNDSISVVVGDTAGVISVTASNDCYTSTSTELSVTPLKVSPCSVGIEENELIADLHIFPNPNSGVFTLSFGKMDSEIIELKVLNTLGQVVYTSTLSERLGNTHTLNTGLKTAGVYFLELNLDGKFLSRKLFVGNN